VTEWVTPVRLTTGLGNSHAVFEGVNGTAEAIPTKTATAEKVVKKGMMFFVR
jgi:hypothetical protein